jgi:hypothetical protein
MKVVLGLGAHFYNPIYLRGGVFEDYVSRPVQAKSY